MPHLKEWMVNYPAYWTAAQGRAYMQDLTTMLNTAIAPAMMALGPVHAASILLSVVASIARGNPVYVNDLQGILANTYDLLDKIRGVTEGTKH